MRSLVTLALLGALAALSSSAHAQQPNGQRRGFVVVGLSPRAPNDPDIGVDIDGRVLPEQTLGAATSIPSGHHVVHAWAKGPDGAPLTNGWASAIYVPPGVTYSVTVPRAVYGPSSGLIGGGVVVSVLGVGSFIGSVFSFYFADGAGTQCHEEGIATGVCGQDPAPYLGLGGATLFFGLAGMIGGPIMIAEGFGKRVSWEFPDVRVGPTGASLTFHF